ncbi:MAG: hypothetical protein KAV44_10220 [Bacteroidales bacterium]|nr:hypothetical protein [Bacteroidales bacterium]
MKYFIIALLTFVLVKASDGQITNPDPAYEGVIILESGDTILFTKYESGSPKSKYWTKDNTKPIKISFLEVRNIFFIPTYSFSKDTIDEFTGKWKRYLYGFPVGGESYASTLYAYPGKISSENKSTYFIHFKSTNDLGCSGGSGNYVIIKLMNGDVVKLNPDKAKISCKKNPISTYYLKGENLSKLRTNQIKAIRFKQTEKFSDFDIIFPDFLIKSIEVMDN